MKADQPNWEEFWQETMTSYKKSSLLKWRYMIIARYGLYECWRLLKRQEKINSLLELGGGGGYFTEILARKLGINSQNVVLVDKSSEGQKAWQLFSGFGNFVKADFLTYNFGRRKFDLVVSRGLIEHWADSKERLAVIKKHRQLSKKYVLIRVPKESWFINLLMYRNWAIRFVRDGDDGFEKLYGDREFKSEITQAGLRIIGFKEGLMSYTILASVK